MWMMVLAMNTNTADSRIGIQNICNTVMGIWGFSDVALQGPTCRGNAAEGAASIPDRQSERSVLDLDRGYQETTLCRTSTRPTMPGAWRLMQDELVYLERMSR